MERSRARRVVVLGAVVPLLNACTLVGTVPAAPAPAPGTVARTPATASGRPASRPVAERTSEPGDGEATGTDWLATRVVEVALASIGTPYEWGGTDANGFDCSGLIQFAYAKLGIRLPRVSRAQMRSGTPVEPRPALLQPGDVLGFSVDRSGRTSHVGLYIGGDEFIHSSSSGVRISTLRDSYWQRRLIGARRIVG